MIDKVSKKNEAKLRMYLLKNGTGTGLSKEQDLKGYNPSFSLNSKHFKRGKTHKENNRSNKRSN